jgi:cytochrome c oxidase cbb3-type subunit 2
MPAYPWLAKNGADAASISTHMKALRIAGVPYTDEEIAQAPGELKGKTEQDALVAYLQSLGRALK